MFGPLNTASTIADAVSDSIKAAIAENVKTLPLMSESVDRQTSLIHILQQTYWRNVDVFEVYTQRNIFSLQMYSASRRATIVDCFTGTKTIEDVLSDMPVQSSTASTTTAAATESSLVQLNVAQVPTAEQMQAVETETVALREKLESLCKSKANMRKELGELEVAQQLADMAGETVTEQTAVDTIHDKVTAAVMATEGLQQLQGQAKQVLNDLENTKRERSPDETVDLMVAAMPAKKKNLYERYEDRKALASTANLVKVHEMIQE